MGCSASKDTSAMVTTPNSANTTASRGVPTTSKQASTAPTAASPQDPDFEARLQDGPSTSRPLARGYSSGESSDTDSESGPGHRRRSSTMEAFDLCSIKDTVHANGNLNGKVVRMETPFGKPIEEIYDGVHTGPVLGSGVSGIVRLVTHKATGVKYAVKCLDLGLITTDEGLAQLREEIYIMCQLDHPNIVRLEEVYESPSRLEIYLVLELCHGGDLFDRLDEQTDFHYTEAQCARLVKQMLSSVRYLHSKNIVHRDLKLENFLFSSRDGDSVLKMIDFGLSKHFAVGESQSQAVGTPYTVAPEIIKGSYNEKCDVWAVGVIAYLLLSGETPFGGVDGEALTEVRENILRGTITFEPADIWDNVSDLAKDFVNTTLRKDTDLRPSAKGAQRHPWIQTYSKKAKDEGGKLNPNVVNALVAFKEYSDMRKLICEVLSFTLLPDQIKDLREEFEKIDDGDGEISLADLKQVLLESAEARSLGGMAEQEVEDVFNALRVRKSETKIRWHEFIAAGLSQCKVDERNLRLAFDRIDNARNGYITFENVMELVGETDACENKESLKVMWMESIKHINGDLDRITVDDFMRIMKGQAFGHGEAGPPHAKKRSGTGNSMRTLDIVPEGKMSPQIERSVSDFERFNGSAELKQHAVPNLKDDADVFGELAVKPRPEKTELPPMRQYYRLRSRSLEHNKTNFFDGIEDPEGEPQRPGPRPSVLLPTKSKRTIETVVEDETMTPLMANKAIYRAHRGMRIAVMEASKRFEEQQRRRKLPKKEGKSLEESSPALVMRRGTLQDTLSVLSESQQFELKKNAQEQALESASLRSGRPRRNRQKTVSDMTGMMANL